MKNLFKFLLLGAFTFSLSVGFVGCKNYDKDIEAICDRLETIEDLLGIPGTNKLVSDVTTATDGITIHYTDGSTAIVKIGGEGVTGIQDAYVVKNDNGSWTLYAQEKGKTDYVQIPLAGAASALAKVEILGWTSSYGITGNPDGNLSLTDGGSTGIAYVENGDPFEINYAYIEQFSVSPAASAKFGATDEGGSAVPAGSNNIASTLNTNTGKADPNAWAGGAHPTAIKTVVNTLGAERRGIVIEVFPATVDASSLKFAMFNNQGKELPIAWGTPEPIKGKFTTRAAQTNALYFVPGSYDAKTYDSATAYDALIDGTAVEDTVYAFYVDGVKVSEYTKFAFDGVEIIVTKEAAVKTVKNVSGTETAPLVTTGSVAAYNVKQNETYKIAEFNSTGAAVAPGASGAENDAVVDYYFEIADKSKLDQDEFVVEISADKTTFKVTRLPDALTVATFDLNVYKLSVNGDIYKEKISVRPIRTGFSYTEKLGNNLITDEDTKATGFSDGATAYDTDNNKSASKTFSLAGMFADLATKPFDNSTLERLWKNDVNGAQTYQFKGMKIGGVAVTGTSSDTSTDLGKWVAAFEAAGGAIQGWTGANGSGTGSTQVDDTQAAGTWNTANSITLVLPYAFADGVFDGGTWDASKYGYTKTDDDNDLADAAWVVGKEYEFTMDFVDDKGVYINTLVVTITPTIPSLADLIKRQTSAEAPGRWTGDLLNAYYKDPVQIASASSLAATNTNRTFQKARYDIAVGVYGGGTMVGAGGDGGFTKLGGGDGDKQWANVSFVLDPDQKVGNVAYAATAAPSSTTAPVGAGASIEYAKTEAESDDDKIFEVYYQTAVGSVIADGGSTTAKVPTGATNAYNFAMNVFLEEGTKYLGLYNFDDAVYEDAAFQIKLASALDLGTIKPVEGSAISMPAASAGTVQKLTSAMIKGYTYNNQPYDLFTYVVADKAQTSFLYKYTYIQSVKFEVPAEAANIYYIVDADDDNITTEVPLTTAEAAASKAGDNAYVLIKSGNISGTTPTTIKVTVTDRFGRVKTENVPITITVQ